MLEPRTASGASGSPSAWRRWPATAATSSQDARPERAGALPVAALVKADRREPQRHRRAREIVVALLARIGAVQDHHAAPGGRPGGRGQPQRVGQSVEGAGLGGKQRGDGAQAQDHIFQCCECHRERAFARLSAGQPRQRARPPRAGRLRRGRARPRVRHAGLRGGGGRPALPGPRVRRRARRPPPRLRRAVRLQGVSLHRRLPGARRRGPGLRRRLRRGAGAGAERGLRAPSAPTCTATPSPRRSCARRWRPAWATSCSTRATRSTGWPAIAAEAGIRQDVLIRVTPGVSGDTHHAISTGQADSKFGFSIDQARDAIARAGRPRLAEPRRPALPHRVTAVRARAVPRRRPRDRRPRRLPGLQPRRRPGRAVHARPAAARPGAVGGGDRRRGPRRARRLTSACCSSPAAPWWPTPR